jgi:hypothetical protein
LGERRVALALAMVAKTRESLAVTLYGLRTS